MRKIANERNAEYRYRMISNTNPNPNLPVVLQLLFCNCYSAPVFRILPEAKVNIKCRRVANRRLANGTVHCAGSATYQIWFRLPIPNPNLTLKLTLTLTLKLTKIQNDTGIKFNIRVISKSYFHRAGGGVIKGL